MVALYVAMPDGLLVVMKADGQWQVDRQLEGKFVHCLALDPLQPRYVYCGTAAEGLWRSDDAGASWEPAGAGIIHEQVMAVEVSGTERAGERGVVYAGTEPTALFRSEDGGDSWQQLSRLNELPSAPTWSFPPRPHTSHVRAMCFDPHAPGRLLVAIEAGALVRSQDGGQSWEDRRPGSPYDSHTLAMHPIAPGRVYSSAGDGYFESRDGGDSWQRVHDSLLHHYMWSLAVDPGDPDTVVASATHGPGQAHNESIAESAVYRKTIGTTWEQVQEGLPPGRGMLAPVLAASETEPGVFYMASNHGLYRSPDAGLTWEQLDIPWPGHGDQQRPQALKVVMSDK